MKPLTSAQRKALDLANHKGGAPIALETPSPKGHVTVYMARRLVELGWATRVNDTLLTTKAGRRELNAPIPEGPDVHLRVGWGLTTLKRDAVLEEIVIDPDTLNAFWKHEAKVARAEEEDPRQHARRLSRRVRRLPAPVVTRWECPVCGGAHPLTECEAA